MVVGMTLSRVVVLIAGVCILLFAFVLPSISSAKSRLTVPPGQRTADVPIQESLDPVAEPVVADESPVVSEVAPAPDPAPEAEESATGPDPEAEPALPPTDEQPAQLPWHELEGEAACEAAALYMLDNPEGENYDDADMFVWLNCMPPAEPTEADGAFISSVTSDAPCSVTMVGTGFAAFSQISLDFDSLIQTTAGYQSYLRVYQPGDLQNFDTTTVSVDAVDGEVTVHITDSSICGRDMIVTSALFGDNSGTGWYDPVHILEAV